MVLISTRVYSPRLILGAFGVVGAWKAVDTIGVDGMDLRKETKRSLN